MRIHPDPDPQHFVRHDFFDVGLILDILIAVGYLFDCKTK
jgi:hypothetical protein